MKKIIYGFCVIIFFILSCSKDLGNYDYHDITEITIKDLGGNRTLLYKTDTLVINPELEFSMDGENQNRYTYEWKLVSSANVNINTKKGTIIGTERNLVYPVMAAPGAYTLYLKVKDNETGVVWAGYTLLSIKIPSATGFLLIGEDGEGFVEVEMIAMSVDDTTIIKGLSHDNGAPRFKGAVDILHTGTYPPRPNINKQWIIGKEHAFFVDPASFETSPDNIFRSQLFTSYDLPQNIFPVDIAPRINNRGGTIVNSLRRIVVTNTGDAFTSDLTSGGNDFYGNPVNRLAGVNTPTFKVFPKIMHGPGSLSNYTLFDLDNKRFVFASSSAANVSLLGDRPTDPFPWNQTDRTIVYAENTRNTDGGSFQGNVFALMKNETSGQYFIYKFASTSTPVKRNGYTVNTSSSADLAKSKFYSFSSLRTALFFVDGSKLFAYDYSIGNDKTILIKDFGDEITMIKSDIQTGVYTDLYVATYNQTTKGTMHKMVLTNNTNTIELIEDESAKWTGLSKIVNMSWKNSSN